MRLIRTLLFYCLSISFAANCQAQKITEFQKDYQLDLIKTTDVIKIDGILDEAIWANTKLVNADNKKFPNNIGEVKRKTEVRLTFDEKNIYFAFKVYDSGTAIIKSLKRDVGHDGNDGIGIVLDPLNQKTNGFFFVLSAMNVQSEDQLSSSTERMSDWSWDTKWFSATKDYGNFWVAEIMIPLKSLRYDPDQKHWGINFIRIDAKNVQYNTWAKVPPTFRSYDLGYTGVIHWPTTPPMNSNNLIIQPYITGTANEDKQNNKTLNANGNAGFDAKVAVNTSLNLDITVNPDFSQVEVDQQVTNLTRFNIFLPERRNFFIENSDLFANFGIPPVRPFYSRTIGLDRQGNRIPILFGARMSGNLAPGTRIGVMNMQTGRQGDYSPENFSAITLHKRVLKRSEIKGYFLNRENYISKEEALKNPLDRYGRNAGITFEYSNVPGTFSSWATYHQSMKPNITDLNSYVDVGIATNKKHWNTVLEIGNLGKNYYTDMGFVERINNYDALRDTVIRMGYKNSYAQLTYLTQPPNGKIGKFEVQLENYTVLNPDNTLNESTTEFGIQTDFKNSSNLKANLENNVVDLIFPTSFTGGTPLPRQRYQYSQFLISFMSDTRKELGWFGDARIGNFYNGTIRGISAGIQWRNQPNLNIRLRAELNNINLPGKYGSTKLLLIAPRIEYNFNTQLFWTTFIQYNTQSNNFNINSRLQYRYKPMSDFFLVYTDNYFTDPLFKNKSRALIFKFSYWLNM
ncbi:MAG: hypothetical protein EXR15_02175 [Chitinophagaceae bacterium]|nr:hypothetical protein [Chitinophagaceae bacterium]